MAKSIKTEELIYETELQRLGYVGEVKKRHFREGPQDIDGGAQTHWKRI